MGCPRDRPSSYAPGAPTATNKKQDTVVDSHGPTTVPNGFGTMSSERRGAVLCAHRVQWFQLVKFQPPGRSSADWYVASARRMAWGRMPAFQAEAQHHHRLNAVLCRVQDWPFWAGQAIFDSVGHWHGPGCWPCQSLPWWPGRSVFLARFLLSLLSPLLLSRAPDALAFCLACLGFLMVVDP